MALTYLARGPYCYGIGLSREEAVRNAKQHFPRSYFPSVKRVTDKHFSIFTSTGTFSVDTINGSIRSTVDDITKLQTSCLTEEE